MFVFKYVIIYLFFFIYFPLTSYANSSDKKFNTFINDISKDAQKKGISAKVIKQFKKKAYFIPRVIELDRSQPEFKLTLDQYLKRVVTPLRIKKANKKFKENKILLNKIAKHYGVQVPKI